MMTNREKFRFYLKDLESPDLFIDWNFYFMISSCLGRKVWYGDEGFVRFPNLYLWFVGPPAVGKTMVAAKGTKAILKSLKRRKEYEDGHFEEVPIIKMQPDSVTLECLYDTISSATELIKVSEKPKKRYAHASACFVLGDEVGLLFREKTNDIITFLTAGYDCDNFERKTRHFGSVSIINMCINFLGCCAPDWLARNMNSSLINEGLSSRTIFIWGDKPRQRSPKISISPEQVAAKESLRKHLLEVTRLYGEVNMTDEAWKWWCNWIYTKEDKPRNKDKKLADYYGRKRTHLLKLAMAVHFADKLTLQIDVEDFREADALLERTEIDMHKALLSQGRNPIKQLAEDIKKYLENKGTAEHKRLLYEFYDQGNFEEIQEALVFLGTTKQITPEQPHPTAKYKLKAQDATSSD